MIKFSLLDPIYYFRSILHYLIICSSAIFTITSGCFILCRFTANYTSVPICILRLFFTFIRTIVTQFN